MPQAWPQQIERALSESDRPLIVTNYYPTYLDLPYRFEPLDEAYLVRAEPREEMPDGLIPLNARFSDGTDAIQLLGTRATGAGSVRPGESVTVELAWQPVVPLQRGYSFSVQLIGSDGVPRGQRDRRHDAAPTYAPGEVLVDRYQFPVFLTAEPGTYQLLASVYYTGEDGTWRRLDLPDGKDAVSLGTVDLLPAEQAPVSAHPQYRPFLAGPTLVGVDYDDTLPEGRRIYLHWRGAPRPAVAQLFSGEQLLAQAAVPAVDPAAYTGARDINRSPVVARTDATVTGRTGYLSVALDVPPGTRDLRLSLIDAQTGQPLACRGPWGLPLRAPLPLPAPPPGQHYLPFGGKLALTGVQASSTWEAGEPVRVALRFLGLRPIVLDYVVSVRVDGVQVTPGPSDSVPALGAIPTFKWIRGSYVDDVHLLETLPGTAGQGQLVVGIYDAFTTESLMPLDERIARLGLAGVPLQPVTVR
jgi:hypothetical protein